MNLTKVLIFDVSGEYGHFRKYNTTTSPLTYSILTRVALGGLLGAVLGMEREKAPGIFPAHIIPVQEVFAKENASFAIQLLAPVKKVNIGFNLLDTGTSPQTFFNIEQRTQIEFELLKNPRFRVFVALEDEALFNELAEKLAKRKHHYTPYLGLSQFTATIDFVAVTPCQRVAGTGAYVDIHTAVNLSRVTSENPVQFDREARYSTDTMPVAMTRNRIVTEYAEILIESTGKPVKVKAAQWFEVPQYGNLLFL